MTQRRRGIAAVAAIQNGRTMPRAQKIVNEPDEGFTARWIARRQKAIRRCKTDPQILTWPQAVSCALNVAYPEAAPWIDPRIGDDWMQEAAALVEIALNDAIAQSYGSAAPQAWQAMLWIRGERELRRCVEQGVRGKNAILICAAQAMYPSYPWPPGPSSASWAKEFWSYYTKLAEVVL